MNLENAINATNEYYASNDVAYFYKKPIPIQDVKVDYERRSAAKISEAYYKIPSTTDYNGIYRGKYIDFEAKELKRYDKLAFQIEELDEKMQSLSDLELQSKTSEFKNRLSEGETLDDILVEAFAVVREAASRVLNEKPFHVQIIGGLTIHYGNIAEMKTGEGKTLTSTMPAYLNALEGKGVHIVTANEYLSCRDADWMGQIYQFLGLTVGKNMKSLSPTEKREAYSKDITYSTNNELGFDYLRDNMAIKKENRVQRGLNFVIIDEVDSILIDESRTPLIISGGSSNNQDLYLKADRTAKMMSVDDYVLDEKTKKVTLTEDGIKKAEKMNNFKNLYDIENAAFVHNLDKALSANYGFKKDIDYVVENDKVVIVDMFTGRLMHGRQFSEGLHQAIEAKEGVEIQKETRTLATITFQNLFRMYNKLAGMTGTAKTEEEEFRNIYNMYVIEIPTNKPIIREDFTDLIYPGLKGKYKALANVIEQIHSNGQPILVGTASIESSEVLSSYLKKKNIKHELLNAKNPEREALIIENAGQKGSVTIATNMAGRGTDIKLGSGVKELGGLYVIGTERHESRRIDNQLRGRAGRQGDPGTTRFFISMEDDLMIKFGSEKMKKIMNTFGMTDDQAISNKMISRSIENAQKQVEGFNFDRRKALLDYDNVISRQREIIYERRNEILDQEGISDRILETFKDYVAYQINSHMTPEGELTVNDIDNICELFNTNLLKIKKISKKDIEEKDNNEIIDFIYDIVVKDYQEKLKGVPKEIQNDFEKAITLNILDKNWMNHLDAMSALEESVGLRGYAQTNPLQAYALEGFEMFDEMLNSTNAEISLLLLKAEVNQNLERKENKNIRTNDSSEKTTKKQPKKALPKIGRNDPCPCGSGKKYKNCCGK
ncbi:MAG: preprotein translocase subunit SecA [Erysipelotrichia bacterium]|nr:preprotein translocase subunit SecA [Erysipelotrichia bacterium]